jgi:hypothetical protein
LYFADQNTEVGRVMRFREVAEGDFSTLQRSCKEDNDSHNLHYKPNDRGKLLGYLIVLFSEIILNPVLGQPQKLPPIIGLRAASPFCTNVGAYHFRSRSTTLPFHLESPSTLIMLMLSVYYKETQEHNI